MGLPHIHTYTKTNNPVQKPDAIVMEQNERNEELKQEELVKETKAKELVRAERLLQEKKQQLADAEDGLDDLYDTTRVRGKGEISDPVLFPSPPI